MRILRNIYKTQPIRCMTSDLMRRSSRANTNVKYTYDDPSSADSHSDFFVPLRKNIESESPNSSAIGGYSENPLEDDPPTVVPTVDPFPSPGMIWQAMPTFLHSSQLHRFRPLL
ncbi:hypothetical protein MKX03_023552, partial [Papaver bracteatum]